MISGNNGKSDHNSESRSGIACAMSSHGEAPWMSHPVHNPRDSDDDPSEAEGQRDQAISEVEDVIGISIGESQSHFKSPRTPAVEKAQALEKSKDYFLDASEPFQPIASPKTDVLGRQDVDVSKRSSQQAFPRPKGDEDAPASKFEADQQKHVPQRSETSRSFLRDTLTTSRKRASSGSAIIAENIRRLVPDVSLQPWLTETQNRLNTRSIKWATSNLPLRDPGSPKRQSSVPKTNPPLEMGYRKSHGDREIAKNLADGALIPESIKLEREPSHTSPRPSNLRRATSDNSLFLRRQNTSSTSGSGQWNHVHDQVNSRMKAIRDSFQDSGLRLPKLPNFSIKQFGPTIPQTSEDGVFNSEKISSSNQGLTDIAPGRPPEAIRTSSKGKGTLIAPQPRATDGPQRSGHPVLAAALSDLHGDVVVLGGYRGSILRSAKPPHRQLWVPVKVGLNIRRVDLEVGLTTKDEENMEDNIIPSGVLSHIGPVDICRRLLKKLHKSSNAQNGKLRVHNFGYDWRLSPHILSRKLIEFLEKLQCNRPDSLKERGAFIIAHSLGGIITRHAVNQRPDLFAGVLYAGVPQHCVNILVSHGGPFLPFVRY